MGRAYTEELGRMAHTLEWSGSVALPTLPQEQVQSELRVVIGSGGSYTAATALAAHEGDTGHGLGMALTPLQYVQRAHALPPHSAMLISAEGKNRDILHAARMAFATAVQTDVLTFSGNSPLLELARDAPTTRVMFFDPPWGRDGYLATNSLLASVVLGFRLGGSAVDAATLASFLGLYRAAGKLERIADETARTGRLLVLHGVQGLVAAVDLESKLAESAFAFTQVADFRQFAHGRHIQLARPDAPVPVIAFVGPQEADLWRSTRAVLPYEVVVHECALPASPQDAAIAGLLMVMSLVEKVAALLKQDPGQPSVADFARRIHGLDPAQLLPRQRSPHPNPKFALLEVHLGKERASAAGIEFANRLARARFKALVLDFDGTLCETARRYEGLDDRLTPLVTGMLQAGVMIAFASGRGNSLHEDLRKRLPPGYWPRCVLGCYSGSLVTPLDQDWPDHQVDPALNAVQQQLEDLGVHKDRGFKLSARSGQLTIRSAKTESIDVLFTLCTTLVGQRAGWRVFRSAHSLDILTLTASKSAVIDYLVDHSGLDPLTEILRIGDRGEPTGNDSELLAKGLGLSVDGVNRDPESCWLYGDPSLGPIERAALYLGALDAKDGSARLQSAAVAQWQQQLA